MVLGTTLLREGGGGWEGTLSFILLTLPLCAIDKIIFLVLATLKLELGYNFINIKFCIEAKMIRIKSQELKRVRDLNSVPTHLQ